MTKDEFDALFWARIKPNLVTGCWEWQRATSDSGHGISGGKTFYGTHLVHRIAWMMNFSDPGDLCVLHTCDNAKCVNTAHLYLGDRIDNARDRERRGRGGQAKRLGSANGRAKLTLVDVLSIREEYAATPEKKGRMKIGDRYGVSYSLVYKIVSDQNWSNAHAV